MYRVVIVDDEISTGRILERYVTTYMPDFEVLHTFKTGTLAWRFLENQEVDILVTDINMPGLSGIELTSRVVERWPDTAVGIITGYSEFEYARQAINLGVSSFLLKPINLHEFQCAVEHMRQQRQRNLQRRVLQSKTSQEIIEEYISDLQEGQLSQNESYHHFAACGFPFQITQCQGKLVQFRLTQMTDAIADDPERTENAITNVLRMTMPHYVFVPLRHVCDTITCLVLYATSQSEWNAKAAVAILKEQIGVDVIPTYEALFFGIDGLQTLLNPTKGKREYQACNQDQLIATAKEYIAKHYQEEISRYALAERLFINPVYFGRLFKQKTGENFSDYLARVRMQKAVELLFTSYSIVEISEMVGYANPSSFTRVFRLHTSYTPTEYRHLVLRRGGMQEDEEK